MTLDQAAAKLVNPTRLLGREPPHNELGPLADRVRRVLNLQSGSKRDVRFGQYRCTELLYETADEQLWTAEHSVTQAQVEIRHVGRNPLKRDRQVQEAHSELTAFHNLKHEPRVSGPIEILPQDDGTTALIYPARQGPTLLEALEADLPVPAERVILDIADALEAAHTHGIFHGRLSPRWIEVLPEMARVRGFGMTGLPVSPGTQLLDEDSDYLAPEVVARQARDETTDIFGLGKLIALLKPDDDLMNALASRLTLLDPTERTVPAGYLRDALAKAFGVTDTVDGAKDTEQPPHEPLAPELDPVEVALDDNGLIAPGAVIGNYVIDQHIGSGGFSDVYLARQILDGELRTLKVFKQRERVDDLVRHEFNALRRIDDPNVVRVIDGGPSAAGWYIVSEYLKGETLAQRIDNYGNQTTDLDEVVLIGHDLLSALATIHGLNVFHRDVKPENVILVEDKGAVLFDFGVAATPEGKVDGLTMEYWPPDLLAGAETPDADLFAVGVILCELATGEHPYPDRNPHAGREPDLSRVPVGLRASIQRAVSPNRRERFESADQFRQSLGTLNKAKSVTVSKRDRYTRVEYLIAEGRLEEAESLCLPEWGRLLNRIERKRGALSDKSPIIAGLRVGLHREETQDVYRLAQGSGLSPAHCWVYHVSGKPGLMLDVRIAEHEDGEVQIATVDAYDTEGRFTEIVNRRRIGVRPADDGWLMRLDLTTRPVGKRVSTKQPARIDELSEDAGVDVERLLLDAGARTVGKRIDLGYSEPKTTKNAFEVVIPDEKRNEVALLGYLLQTVVPLAREAGLLLDDQE